MFQEIIVDQDLKYIFTLFFLSHMSLDNVSVYLKGKANILTYDESLHAVDQTVEILRQNKQIHHGFMNALIFIQEIVFITVETLIVW